MNVLTLWYPSHRDLTLLESPKASCPPWPSFLGSCWSWCRDLAPNCACSWMGLPDTCPVKRLQKKHHRETGPGTRHTCVGEGRQGSSGWTRWIGHNVKGHDGVKNDSRDTTLQLMRAAAGAHLGRDSIAMKNGEWSLLMSQRSNRPSPQGIPYNWH